jgi:hypothetical protein
MTKFEIMCRIMQELGVTIYNIKEVICAKKSTWFGEVFLHNNETETNRGKGRGAGLNRKYLAATEEAAATTKDTA